MPPRIWPPNPDFQSDGERDLFESLVKVLTDKDAILTNVRFTDPSEGDVEVDLIALIDGLGALVFENKGGHIDFNGQNWLQTDRGGTRKIDPHGQALRGLHTFRNFVRSNWEYGNLKAEWLIALPGSLFGNIQIPGVPRQRILDKVEIPEALERSIKILNESPIKSAPSQVDWVEKVFDIVRGRSLFESDRDVALYNNFHFIKNQTHERKNILSMVQENKRIHVKGPAGSGKTWLAFEQSALWSQEGLKVGIMVFNRGLESYMNRKNAELGGKRKAAWVGTFHNFMKQIGHSAPTMQDYDRNPEKYDAEMLKAVDGLAENQKFDAWIVDEAQDFHDVWWQILEKSLKNPDEGRIAIFGDPNQSVYGKRGFPKGNFTVINLKENLRNSQQIAKGVEKFIDGQVIMRGPQSYEIEFIEVESLDEVIPAADDAVARLADEEMWNLGEIALLTTKHQHPVHRDKANDIEAYWKELWTQEDVFYSTVSGFKGLERSVVVLALDGFHGGRDPEDVVYVGMTRARDRLVVVGTKRDCQSVRLGFQP
jgi:AAA domain/UvrD-like helicase C-terminal domain/Nuclease-related domain